MTVEMRRWLLGSTERKTLSVPSVPLLSWELAKKTVTNTEQNISISSADGVAQLRFGFATAIHITVTHVIESLDAINLSRSIQPISKIHF